VEIAMSNALRIDFAEDSYHKYLVVSIDEEEDFEFWLTHNEYYERDVVFALEKTEAKMLVDYLLEWLDKNGGQP